MPNQEKGGWVRKLRPGRHLLEAWILSAAIVSISNVLAQFIDASRAEDPFTLDLPRLLRFLCLDLITAPLNYKWQELLENTFPRHLHRPVGGKYESIPLEDRDEEKGSLANGIEGDDAKAGESSGGRYRRRRNKTPQRLPKKNWKNIWTKWFIDCMTLGALFNTVGFLIIMGFLNGQPQNILANLRTRTMVIVLNGYKIWPFANIVAQAFIPFERRIVFFATVALVWNIYLSLVAATL
ncbi:hypothetical protein G647_06013 [Cladophialophora carrionii CBS 160.54]|uniref:Uncharacterized protein n=1 Tax=Cladophialophora carrionii CBS 160.54 TaxID=1279043 RepID=V9D6P1_9EURO|nr:uncharacterized protein G647_06013 [Cladophialophora carrionii CBS 160.54]ETI21943.1 hypothetical protein G647_06013 [Cladophialophora carrionii CBS 160.54]